MENNKKNIQEKSKKKDKLFFAIALVVILVISILTANVNLSEKLSAFVEKIWNDGQEAVRESEKVKTLSKGAHTEIKNTQTARLAAIYKVLGKEISEEQAIAILQEVKTLAYHGSKRGVAASGKEVESCINDLKERLKAADQSEYNRMIKTYGDEDDYWTLVKDEVKEYVVSEKMKEEKRTELKKKKDADVEKELQEYVDEIVGYENFQ